MVCTLYGMAIALHNSSQTKVLRQYIVLQKYRNPLAFPANGEEMPSECVYLMEDTRLSVQYQGTLPKQNLGDRCVTCSTCIDTGMVCTIGEKGYVRV